MTIQRQRHSDVIKYQPKQWNDKNCEDFEKFTYFSNHEDDIQFQQILAWSKTIPK